MKLFTPGPVQVKQSIVDASAKAPCFHRAKGFEELYASCKDLLNKVYQSDETKTCLILNGSGTYANETVVHSLTTKNDKILLLSNGDFGDRFEKMLTLHQRNFKIHKKEHGDVFILDEIEDEIRNYKPHIVIIVALETSTGIINPIPFLGDLSQTYNFRLFVDAVSALGAEDISVTRDNIAVCTSVPNKAIESLPGISFVCVDKALLEETRNVESTSLYLDLHKYYDSSLKNQTQSTPGVNIYYALEEALKGLIAEGLEKRRERYKRLSSLVRTEIKNIGFNVLNIQNNDSFAANAISCMQIPKKYKALDLHNYLYKNDYTLWFYNHDDVPVQDNVMQVSVMGDITEDDIHNLFSLISEVEK